MQQKVPWRAAGMDTGRGWRQGADGYSEVMDTARGAEPQALCGDGRRSAAFAGASLIVRGQAERAGGVAGRLSPLQGCLVAAGARGTGAGEFEASILHTGARRPAAVGTWNRSTPTLVQGKVWRSPSWDAQVPAKFASKTRGQAGMDLAKLLLGISPAEP